MSVCVMLPSLFGPDTNLPSFSSVISSLSTFPLKLPPFERVWLSVRTTTDWGDWCWKFNWTVVSTTMHGKDICQTYSIHGTNRLPGARKCKRSGGQQHIISLPYRPIPAATFTAISSIKMLYTAGRASDLVKYLYFRRNGCG